MNNMAEFNKMYNDALIKTAIGVHIINTIGAKSGVTEEIQRQNISTLCSELAYGINLDLDTVLSDVMVTRNRFPADFFQHAEVISLMDELQGAMQRQNLLGYLQ